MYLYIYCMKNNLNDAFAHQHKEQDDDNHILSHVSDRAHIVFDFHQAVDGISEHRLGGDQNRQSLQT